MTTSIRIRSVLLLVQFERLIRHTGIPNRVSILREFALRRFQLLKCMKKTTLLYFSQTDIIYEQQIQT